MSSLIDRRGFLPQDVSVQTVDVDEDLPPPAADPDPEHGVVGGASQEESPDSPVCRSFFWA